MNNTCNVCEEHILLMCRKGTGICGETCQKIADASSESES